MYLEDLRLEVGELLQDGRESSGRMIFIFGACIGCDLPISWAAVMVCGCRNSSRPKNGHFMLEAEGKVWEGRLVRASVS